MSSQRENGHREIKQPPIIRSTGWIIAGAVVSAVMLACALWFSLSLSGLGMLPMGYLVPILVILWVVVLVVSALQFFRVTEVSSKVGAAIVLLILALGIFLLGTVTGLLNKASNVTVSVDTIQVYVLNDDPAQTLSDAKDYQFGILSSLDRNNTDECLTEMENELGSAVATTEYDSMAELAQALLDSEVGAIVVNSAYINTLDEVDGLTEFADQVRVLWGYDIQRELEISHTTDSEEAEDAEEAGDGTVLSEDGDLQPFVVYISGNDATGTLKSTGRSDVNILMAVNPSTHEILLVNTPRDYYVELAGIGEYDKLTHASIYGVDVSMNTLGNLYGVQVSYYARMNFTGFIEIVDALGGITVESSVAFTAGGYTFVEGENTLDGTAALAFARERHSFASGDRQRGINQMAVIQAVIKKMSSPAILTGYLDIMNAASEAFETNMTQDEIAELVKYQLESGESWSVSTMSVDGSDSMGPVYSAPNSNLYRMIPDDDSVAAAVAALNELLTAQ
ncbi:MAG: LCP family protein [Oscillospiraceae bacterium]|nr:LCP family protein [Oscillospiraceae bacterium]